MSYKPVSIPALPVNADPQMRHFLTSIKESLEVRLSQRGNALDASPTFQDLLDTGILKIKDGLTTIGGKQYSAEQLLGLVQFTLPNWITSDTAPPAPTGLVVSADRTNMILGWDASTFDQYSQTEVWRAGSNNLSLAELVGSTTGNTYTDGLPTAGEAYYYWIRDIAYNFLAGPFNDVNGASTNLGPGPVTVTHTFVGADADVSWGSPTSNLAVSLYRIEQYIGGTWQLLDIVSGNSHRFKVTWGGSRQFRIIAIDINGNEGAAAVFSIAVTSHTAPAVTNTFDGEQVVLTWTASSGSLPVDYYEVFDTSISTAALLSRQYSTVYRNKVLWLNKTFLVRSVDTAGNAGATRTVIITVSTGQVVDLSTEVIDNNVLFRWSEVRGSLPILSFELRRGDVWATSELIGTKSGGFTTVFEAPQSPVTYTYLLAAVDTAGNYGVPASVTARVTQPPDYVLATNHISTYNGTLSSAVLDPSGAGLVIPVNTSETWDTHFSSRGWATPDAQVAAGYPIFIQPGAVTGYYEEIFDYGATLAAMKMTVSYLLTTIAGTLSSAVTITTALDSGFTSNVQTYPDSQAYATNFRYVKFRVTVTATNNIGIASLVNLTLKLDTKLKTQTGSVTANAADSGGTIVYLTEDRLSTGNRTFIDVESINVAANSTTPLYAVYDYVDTYSPLSFKVLLFNSSGTRVSGGVSYSVRGY
jgi:hypothetical protein